MVIIGNGIIAFNLWADLFAEITYSKERMWKQNDLFLFPSMSTSFSVLIY